MISNKKAIIFPGTFQFVKNYGGYKGIDIWLKTELAEDVIAPLCLIGHSLGANFALSIYDPDSDKEYKFILINPLLKKRNVFNLFWRWVKFILFEGIKREKIIPMSSWFYALKKLFNLLKVDLWSILQKIPGENIEAVFQRLSLWKL